MTSDTEHLLCTVLCFSVMSRWGSVLSQESLTLGNFKLSYCRNHTFSLCSPWHSRKHFFRNRILLRNSGMGSRRPPSPCKDHSTGDSCGTCLGHAQLPQDPNVFLGLFLSLHSEHVSTSVTTLVKRQLQTASSGASAEVALLRTRTWIELDRSPFSPYPTRTHRMDSWQPPTKEWLRTL